MVDDEHDYDYDYEHEGGAGDHPRFSALYPFGPLAHQRPGSRLGLAGARRRKAAT